ncbi:hypothetical protein NXF25_014014 [Crotalus adamanteus]|uniref:Uncharacterized protein n=1 Tax=Crotalus adamanteus TaxID=8729 RepID=A0AAW1BAR3_CROAD
MMVVVVVVVVVSCNSETLLLISRSCPTSCRSETDLKRMEIGWKKMAAKVQSVELLGAVWCIAPYELSYVGTVTLNLEGDAVQWLVSLYDEGSPELMDVDALMQEL